MGSVAPGKSFRSAFNISDTNSQYACPACDRWTPERYQMTALNNFNEQIREFYQQAVDCARQADAQNDPKVKEQFLELKRLWLLLAERLRVQ
jgi:hypothetical protein